MSNIKSEFKIITQSELAKIHTNHQKWLENPKHGKQAEFINFSFPSDNDNFEWPEPYNFSKCKINKCDFSQVDLASIIFSDSEILHCTFEGATLDEVNFTNSIIINCNFIDASDLDTCIFKDCNIYNCIFDETAENDNPSLVKSLSASNNTLIQFLKNNTSPAVEPTRLNNETFSVTGKLPVSTGIVNFIANSIGTGIQLSIGKRVSETLNINVKRALKTANVPQEFLDRKIVNIALSVITPQLLKLLVPFIPKLKNSNYAVKAIELACFASATTASSETFDYITEFVTPIIDPFMKSLNSPQLKADLKKALQDDELPSSTAK